MFHLTENQSFFCVLGAAALLLGTTRLSVRREAKYTKFEARCHKDRWKTRGIVVNAQTDLARDPTVKDAYMLFGFHARKGRWEMLELADSAARTWEWHQQYGCEVPDIEYDTQESLVASLPPAWA